MHTSTSALNLHIKAVFEKSTIPLSAEQIQNQLADRGIIYSYRHIKRKINEMCLTGIVELVAKDSKLQLYSLKGRVLEPYAATVANPNTAAIQLKIGGRVYSPDELARALFAAPNTTLTEETYRNLSALLTLLVLGNSSWETLSLHSLTPVAHVRRPLEEINQRLKNLSGLIDTVLNNEHVKTGAIGNSISSVTRDNLLTELDTWLTQVSTNVRSNIE